MSNNYRQRIATLERERDEARAAYCEAKVQRDEARAAYQGLRETYVGMTGDGLANDILCRNGYPHKPEWRKGGDT